MSRVHVAPRATANGKLEVYGAPPLSVVPSEQLRLQPTSTGYDPLEQLIVEDADVDSGEGEGAEDDNARSEAFARAAEESFVVRQLSKVLPLITRYDPQGRLLVKQALVAKGEGLLGGGGGGGGIVCVSRRLRA